MFAQLEVDNSIEVEKDSVGGFSVLDSNIYPTKINMAYTGESTGGALSVTLHLGTATGQEIRETVYVSSGKAKGQKTYYEAKDGSRKNLPGYSLIQSLCKLTTDKDVSQIPTEEKVIKLYDREAKKEVPTKVQVVTELLDKEVYTGLLKEKHDKTTKQGDDYVPTGETFEKNAIDKFFRAPDKMTYAEAINSEVTEATFFNEWLKKNEGQVRDKTSKTSGSAGAPKAAQAKPAATQSLFS